MGGCFSFVEGLAAGWTCGCSSLAQGLMPLYLHLFLLLCVRMAYADCSNPMDQPAAKEYDAPEFTPSEVVIRTAALVNVDPCFDFTDFKNSPCKVIDTRIYASFSSCTISKSLFFSRRITTRLSSLSSRCLLSWAPPSPLFGYFSCAAGASAGAVPSVQNHIV